MIMGHVGFGEKFDYFIHAFHMPIFFFFSGMFFKTEQDANFKLFTLKKFRSLIIPYIFWGFFHYIIWLWFNKGSIGFSLIKNLLWSNTSDLPIAGALWFLTALFFSEIIYFLIKKYIRNWNIRAFIIIVISIIGCAMRKIISVRLPYAIDAAFVGIGLMFMGEIFQINRECLIIKRLQNMKTIEYILGGIVTTISIFFNGYINMRQGLYGIIPIFWMNVLFAIIIGMKLSQNIEKYFPKTLGKMFEYCGRNSIVFVCLNQLPIFLMNRSSKIMGLNIEKRRMLMLGISLIVLYIVTYIIMNTRLSILVGKNNNEKGCLQI